MGDGTAGKARNVVYVVFSSGHDDPPNPVYAGHKFLEVALKPDPVVGPPSAYPAPWRWGYGAGDAEQPKCQLWNYAIDGHVPYTVLTGETLLRMKGIPDLDPDDPANTAALNAALDDPDLVFPVDLTGYPDGFDDLVLYYAFHEGGPNLTVAAIAETALGPVAIKPAAGPAPSQGQGSPPASAAGEDAACPIAEAFSADDPEATQGDPFALSAFAWDPDGVGLYGVPGTGGWVTTAIGSQQYLDVVAKPEMTLGGSRPQRYRFDRWVYRTKLQGFDLPDPSRGPRYPLPAQLFGGAIAYYRPRRAGRLVGTVDEPITIPQPISIVDPPIRPLLVLIAHAIAYDVAALAGGLLRAVRHAPGTAGHGRAVEAPAVDAATRSNLAALAARHPDDGGALERALGDLHR